MPATLPPPAGRKHPHFRAAAGHGDRPVGVGAQYGRPRLPQSGERTGCGVPVTIGRADGDHGEPGPEPRVQLRVLVRGAVVRDLDDIHRTQVRMVPQEGLLRGRFEIAEQEQGQPRTPDQQGDARVVGTLGRRPGRRRPEHLPLERSGPPPLPRHRPYDGYARAGRGPVDQLRLPRRLFQRGGLNHTHRPAPQHSGQASHVVGVKVRQHQHRHPAHAQGTQAGIHGSGIGPGVHHQGLARAEGQYRGVPLPHGALHVAPVGRRPAGEGTGELRRPQYGQEQQHRQGGADPPPPADPGAEQYDGHRGGGQQQPAGEPARPGQFRAREPRPGPGHGGDPPRGHPRAPGEHPRGGHPQRGHGERREAEHRRRTGRQLGQQVARHRHEADPGGERRDHGRAHRLGGRGGPQRLGEPGPHPAPAQGHAPPGREGEQGAGGQDREQESVTAGQPGVVEDQQQNGGAQRRDQGPAPPRGEGQQGDRPAGRGPQHARLRPAHHHERQRQGRPAQGGGPQREPEPGRQPAPLGLLRTGRGPDEQEQDHGQVGPGHGQQVQQVGGLEGLVQIGRNPGRVPDDQPRQQGPGIRRQPLGGLAQPGPQSPGEPLRGVRAAGHRRRGVTGRPQQCRGPLALPRRGQPGDDRHPGGGQQPGPSGVPGQHPHRGLDPGPRPVGPGHPGHHRVQHHHRRPASPPGDPRIGTDGELREDSGVLPGQFRHGPGPCLGPLEPGHPGPRAGAQQGRGQRRGGSPPGSGTPAPGQEQQPRSGHAHAHPDGGRSGGRVQGEGGRRPGGQGRRHQAESAGPAASRRFTAAPACAGRRSAVRRSR